GPHAGDLQSASVLHGIGASPAGAGASRSARQATRAVAASTARARTRTADLPNARPVWARMGPPTRPGYHGWGRVLRRRVLLEDLDDLGPTEMPGPADGIAVVLAVADGRVGAGVEEQPHDVRVTVRRRQVQGGDVRVPVRPAGVGVGPVREQPFDRRAVAPLGHEVQHA